jgi:hypothetical protein
MVTRSGAGISCGGPNEILLFRNIAHLGVIVSNIDRGGCSGIDLVGNCAEKQLHGPVHISRTTRAKRDALVFQRPTMDIGWRLFVCCNGGMMAYFMTPSLLSPW